MIQTICICGAGTMGSGIAMAASQSGFKTILYEINPGRLEYAKIQIEKNLDQLVAKKKISISQKEEQTCRIQFEQNIEECNGDIVIEAISEDEDMKAGLFKSLAPHNTSNTIFASNTSSLSIAAIAKKTDFKERVIGMHFFNPATSMKLVEVVISPFTSNLTKELVTSLALQMGKIPILCRDAPGFIVNHVARPFYLEALWMIEQKISEMETIDELMEASGFKMGPFRLMDLIGNDINFAVSESIYQALGKPTRLRPSPIQEGKVLSGQLGRKTGMGYYSYP
ncbi:MAG: 3-hydroxyacyl-CoA dehydrogenase family protein [Chitinophagales bacterium]